MKAPGAGRIGAHRYPQRSRWLLVIYALFDVVWTWARVQRFVAEAAWAEINLMRSDLDMMADSLLLLISAVGVRLGRLWGYLAAIVTGGWLLYRGLYKWHLIASATELPMWSWPVLNYWFDYSEGWWDFPRFFVAVCVVVYVIVVLSRNSKYGSLGDQQPSDCR